MYTLCYKTVCTVQYVIDTCLKSDENTFNWLLLNFLCPFIYFPKAAASSFNLQTPVELIFPHFQSSSILNRNKYYFSLEWSFPHAEDNFLNFAVFILQCVAWGAWLRDDTLAECWMECDWNDCEDMRLQSSLYSQIACLSHRKQNPSTLNYLIKN